MVVVIGAGPAGLYTAIKLTQAGITNLVVYDPRAGIYTRPGHLTYQTFRNAEIGLGIDFWTKDDVYRHGHIKDLERKLYDIAQGLNIAIEQKRFIRLYQGAMQPGVIVADNEGVEEVVPADYVFDCTGSRRDVVHAVNRILPSPPFQITTMADVSVPTNFLAYVKMDERRMNAAKRFFIAEWGELSSEKYNNDFLHINPLLFVRSIVKLRSLGWNEFTLPRCYARPFDNHKVGVYMHAPSHLVPEHYDAWVHAVLAVYLQDFTKSVFYQHLPASRKYDHKPRFSAFKVHAQALNIMSHQGEQLPMVIPLGDAQLDPDYYLGRGINSGINCINELFKTIVVENGILKSFNASEYEQRIKPLLLDYKAAIKKAANRQILVNLKSICRAEILFKKALALSCDDQEKQDCQAFLDQIRANRYSASCKNLARVRDISSNLTDLQNDEVILVLAQIKKDLLIVVNDLPAALKMKQEEIASVLVSLARNWNDIGKFLVGEDKIAKAINAFQNALDLYNLPLVQDLYAPEKLFLYSCLMIHCINEHRYAEASAAGMSAVTVYEQAPIESRPEPVLYEKIIYLFINALYHQLLSDAVIIGPIYVNWDYLRAAGQILLQDTVFSLSTRSIMDSMMTKMRDILVTQTGYSYLRLSGMFPSVVGVSSVDQPSTPRNGF